MSTEGICPVCEKPVEIDRGVYRIDKATYHPKCYEEWRRKLADSERKQD